VRFERARRGRRGPGLTPLIDVVFLLLVFFMLASRFDREGALPLVVGGGGGDPAARVLAVSLAASGEATIDGEVVAGERLHGEVARAAREGRGVRVRPHPDTSVQAIADVLGVLERAGVRDAALERPGAAARADE